MIGTRQRIDEAWSPARCDICGDASHHVLGERSYVVPQKTCDFVMNFVDAVCRRCGFVYAATRPSDEFLTRYYQDAHDLYQSAADMPVDYDAQARLEIFRSNLSPGASVIEIGSGAGDFCRTLLSEGFRAEGIDPKVQMERHGVRQALLESESLAGKRYDAVASYYVMEHLRAPADWLERAGALLMDGGLFAVEVPDFSTHPDESLNNEHMLHFCKEHMQELLRRHGFAIVQQSFRPSRFFGFMTVARLEDRSKLSTPASFSTSSDWEALRMQVGDRYEAARREIEKRERIAASVCRQVTDIVRRQPDTQVVCWGANVFAVNAARAMRGLPVLPVLVDSAKSKAGLVYEGFAQPVTDPLSGRLSREGNKVFVLCSQAWNDSIKAQIQQLDFESYRIVDGTVE